MRPVQQLGSHNLLPLVISGFKNFNESRRRQPPLTVNSSGGGRYSLQMRLNNFSPTSTHLTEQLIDTLKLTSTHLVKYSTYTLPFPIIPYYKTYPLSNTMALMHYGTHRTVLI